MCDYHVLEKIFILTINWQPAFIFFSFIYTDRLYTDFFYIFLHVNKLDFIIMAELGLGHACHDSSDPKQ